MSQIIRYGSVSLVLLISACANVPSGPSMTVLPAPGQSFEQFNHDDGVCRIAAGRHLSDSAKDTAIGSAAPGTTDVIQQRYDEAYIRCMYSNDHPAPIIERTSNIPYLQNQPVYRTAPDSGKSSGAPSGQ
ncbi:hypothetical protein KEF85_08415 [Methylomonas paludis]|uniref:Lipoprotein n=1 Tax=Methylomonas paludis TaxID=1173101 RepID=A0A975R8N2_9GAMM|nr:hypothetical protein [Methylomonas paludis]QWF69408.1 hypothetical protein KEF85_08415 [Methylomonas paludis]